MLRALEVMTHPDGNIALFNDAAFGGLSLGQCGFEFLQTSLG